MSPSRIPADEIRLAFSRSGGPGGQNVNKVATKAEARWNLWRSRVFSDAEKLRMAARLSPRLTQNGELLVTVSETRSQEQNRAAAVARLQSLVAAALVVPNKRLKTKPTRASKERRLSSKKRRSESKRLRRLVE